MAADYNQPPNVEKRVRFFDGQYLQDQDFIDEQKYHIDRQRRHNRTLHVSGIADGLVVSKSAAAQVTVAAGTSIDADGRQLVLAQAKTVDLPSSQLINKTINLYLVYREQQTDLQTQAGSKDNSRWLEEPEIKYAAKGEALQGTYPPVLLAEIPLDASGNITSINANVREYSGLRLPGPSADAPTLRSGANGLVRLEGGLNVTGNLGLGTSSPPTARLEVNGDIKTHVAIINNGGYGDSYACFAYKDKGTQGNYALLQANDGQTFLNAASGKPIYFRINNADKMILDKDGNVGIGTLTPKGFQVTLPESSKGGSAPGAGVTIAGGDNASIELRGTGTPYIDFAKDASTTDYHARIRLTATDKLAIEGANLGIGTTSPGAKLSFANLYDGRDTADGITWHNESPTVYGIHRTAGAWTAPNYQQLRLAWDTGIVLYPGTAYGKSYVDIQGGGLRVTAGNVGIGTPAAAQKLMVVGPHNAGKDADSGMTYGGQLAIKGNAPQLDFIDTDHNDWSIHVNSNKLYFIRQPWNVTDLVLDGSGKVGIGTDGPEGKLTVSASGSHLQLRREGSETTGGNNLFLELVQYDSNPAKVPEVYPSIRFHHAYRFWHRLEARTDGFHMKVGDTGSDAYVPLRVGDLRVNGQFAVGGGQAVTGIPVIEFRSLQQRFSGHSGSAKMLTYSFTFSRPVTSAVPMLSSWFLRYANRELVKEAGVGCYATRVSGTTVAVDVYFYFKDASGNYDDPYEGEAIVVVIAQLSQAV